MYEKHFHLAEPPFRLSPDPQFLYASKQHARAKAYMESTIWLTDGFVVVTGEIGAGKTTLIQSFLADLPEDVVLAHISQTQLTAVQFLQAVLVEFGFEPFRMRKAELLDQLNTFLIEQYAAGKKILLIVDEAQNLSMKVLEEIRLLSGVETHKDKVLRIILAGQPELSEKLDSPELEQLAQRVRLRFHLEPLSKREMRDYIGHRLKVAGAEGREIFTEEVFPMIFRYTGGIPRLVNVLCDTALLCAFADGLMQVDADVIKSAVEELQWEEFSQRYKGRRTARSDSPSINPADTGSFSLARLIVEESGEVVGEQAISAGRLVLGRTADNDLQIRSKFVSRHHAQIISDLDKSVLEDLNSTNGVFVNGARIRRHRLCDSDEIQLGKHVLTYHDNRGQRVMSNDEVYEGEGEEDGSAIDEAGAE